MSLYFDNNSIINIVYNNLVQHDRAKHIDVDSHFVKEKLDNAHHLYALEINLQIY